MEDVSSEMSRKPNRTYYHCEACSTKRFFDKNWHLLTRLHTTVANDSGVFIQCTQPSDCLLCDRAT